MKNIDSLILMVISELLILGLAILLRKEKKSQLKTACKFFLICIFWWTLCSIF